MDPFSCMGPFASVLRFYTYIGPRYHMGPFYGDTNNPFNPLSSWTDHKFFGSLSQLAARTLTVPNIYFFSNISQVALSQYCCSCFPVSILLPMKKLLFWKKMLCSGNLILCTLAKCCDASIFALAAKYHIEPHDIVRSSAARIKDSFGFIFLN